MSLVPGKKRMDMRRSSNSAWLKKNNVYPVCILLAVGMHLLFFRLTPFDVELAPHADAQAREIDVRLESHVFSSAGGEKKFDENQLRKRTLPESNTVRPRREGRNPSRPAADKRRVEESRPNQSGAERADAGVAPGRRQGAPVVLPSHSGNGASSPAVLADNPKPPYPALARKRGQSGTVLLRVVVRPDGSPAVVEVKHSSGYSLLDESARSTVQKWRFQPSMQGGQAVQGEFLLPVEFRLE
ncbi:MAG: TonB family protein [Desulfovibrionaceae bacterium]|nr:TonB family protein [Desulfovibrionaceae bacterium]